MKKIKFLIVVMFVLTLTIIFTTKVYAEEVGGFVPNREYILENEDGDIYLTLSEDGTAKVNGTHDDGTILEFTCEYTTCCENMHLTLNALGNSMYLEMDEEGVITGVDYLHDEDIVISEEEEEYITTEGGNFFLEEIQPILIQAGATFLSFIASSGLLWYIVKKIIDKLSKKVEETNTNNAELRTEIIEVKALKEENIALRKSNEKLVESNNQLYAQNKALGEAFKLIASNNPQMVSSGVAKQVCEIIDCKEEV